jgi:hypothetical protein
MPQVGGCGAENGGGMANLGDAKSDLALAQTILGPIDDAVECLSEAAKALGELSAIIHRYITLNTAGARIDLARQGGTEVGPAEHI